MTDPTTVPPPMTLISRLNGLEDCSTAATDDSALLRLAIWLAEVSAEAAHDAALAAADVAPTALAQPCGADAEQQAAKV